MKGKGGEGKGRTLDPEAFASVCKALGHPARVRILEHLRSVESCICGRIVEILPLAQSTVSQHLKCLKEAGLVIGEVEGPSVCYCVDPTVLERFKKMVETL
jgi:ArsR family transcriptional regulator